MSSRAKKMGPQASLFRLRLRKLVFKKNTKNKPELI